MQNWILSTILANTRQNTVYTFYLITCRQRKLNRNRQTFYRLTSYTSEMKMMVSCFFLITSHTNRKVLLPIFCHNPVQNSVFAEPVKHTVNGCAIHINRYLSFYSILTHCLSGVCQKTENSFFCRCISSFHFTNAIMLQ